MKVMQELLIALVFSLTLAAASVAAQTDYCFQNDGLKSAQMASFTVTKDRVKGFFTSGEYDSPTSSEKFDFTGTKKGNFLTIRFEGKAPYELPPGTRAIVWTLRPRSLKVPMYGKNYNTRKYSTYIATFTGCRKGRLV
jgi:hypothetical protein